MSNTRILYHGTTMENAITMLGSNFSSIVDETVWNCSDDDMLYMAEKDYDGEENEGLRIAAEAAQIAAAYLGSESSDLVVLKLEIPEFMFEEAYVTEDDSCDNMYGCWQIKQNDLKKSCSLGCQAEKKIGVSVIVLHNAYNRELRPFYLPENELLKDLDDQMIATAVHAVHTLTLDDGTITVSGKAKGAYTPSITGRMPKGGELELAYTFLPLAGEEDLDEIVDGVKKAKLTTEWLKKNISDLIAEEKQTPHGN